MIKESGYGYPRTRVIACFISCEYGFGIVSLSFMIARILDQAVIGLQLVAGNRKYRAVRLRDLFLPPGIVKTRLPPVFSFEPDEVLAPEAFEEEFMAPLGQYLIG